MSNGNVCFNSRTPCGVRPKEGGQYRHTFTFQFTHPVRGATIGLSLLPRLSRFQFTHPVRGATAQRSRATALSSSFNSRTPCGVRPGLLCGSLPPLRFQFTHPVRGATSISLRRLKSERFQFTHPVRGATRYEHRDNDDRGVSIHAPRAGCDERQLQTLHRRGVSIHAPQWGATVLVVHLLSVKRFQFTHPSGVRHASDTLEEIQQEFQFTHPSGVRLVPIDLL